MSVRNAGAAGMLVAALAAVPVLVAQDASATAPATTTPQTTAPQVAAPAAADGVSAASGPIAIVTNDSKDAGAGARVTGALEVAQGKAIIGASGSVTSGTETTQVILPHRGVLRVCASTTVRLRSDSGAPAGVVPGLLMAMDHGALEASFATGRDSDVLLTPDFRILIGGPGAADVKVRLGDGGDTCVDNAGVDAPYVLVSSVFDGGAYRVQAGQRVMFQRGNLHEVVDQEKEPCGCPPAATEPNGFPLAQSEGLAPLAPPVVAAHVGHEAQSSDTLAYQGAAAAVATPAVAPSGVAAPVAATPAPAQIPPAPAPEKKAGFFTRVGHFFKRIFGAE